MNFETDVRKISYNKRIKLIETLIIKDCYYECTLLSQLFKENTVHAEEKMLYNNIISICKSSQKREKDKILQMISSSSKF